MVANLLTTNIKPKSNLFLTAKKVYCQGKNSKKAGTTKVTIKFKNNKKESFTVKVYPANTIKAELVSVDYKNFNFKFKNTSKCFFDILGFTFKLYDKNGKLLSSPYGAVQSLQPGSTAYYSFSNWDNIKKEDIAKVKCTIKSSSPLESKHKKYYEKKNHFTVNLTNNIESKTATVKIKNNTKKDLSIPCYLLYYKNNELVYTESIYFSIKAKKSDSSKQTNPYLDYDTVK